MSLQRVQSLAAEIRSYRSNQANDDVTVLETSLRDCYGLLHLHHVSYLLFLKCAEVAALLPFSCGMSAMSHMHIYLYLAPALLTM